MTGFLLSVHVLAALLTIGPVAVAASMFPPVARAVDPTTGERTLAGALHRVTRVYATIGLLVPVFGLATGASLGVLGDPWLVASILLTAAAALLLVLRIVPAQRRVLDALREDAAPSDVVRRLAMQTGIFNLLWATVVVLMIYRPGSTTGAGI